MKPGKFITFEGIDGAGKSTQISGVIQHLRSANVSVVQTREPGGTVLGEKLRSIVLNDDMHLETEALIMFAARREHLAQLIMPALERGDWVVSDRFSDATYAYQVGGRGLSAEKFLQLETWVHPGLQPDITFLFDLDPKIAAQRLAGNGEQRDRFEQEQEVFFQRVREAYLVRAAQFPQRFRIMDASLSPQVLTEHICQAVDSMQRDSQ